MMEKTIYALALGAMCLLTTGCEDYLDIEKHGNMGSLETYYQTDEEVQGATASLFQSLNGVSYNWSFINNLLSDDVWAGGGSRGDNATFEQLNEFNFGSDHGSVQDLYKSLYTMIYNANLIIEKTAGDTPLQKQAIAEAYFFRAWANFQLVALWGTPAKVDHLLAPNEYRQGNASPEEMWAFVEKDLNTAISSGNLPSKSGVNDEANAIRITKETALAMLGKAQVFQGKYSEAAKNLDAVIESKKYDLYRGDYADIIQPAANNSCESMIEVQRRKDTENGTNYYFTWYYTMLGWRTDKHQPTNPGFYKFAQGTWGFCNPRKSLYDAFVATEGKDGYRLNSTLHTYAQMKDLGLELQPGKSLIGHEGYYNWKNRALAENEIVPFMGAFIYTNIKVMRYAEVLLLAAEAHVQSGNIAKATEYVNIIRERAKLAPLATVTMDDVKNEKRLELCFENVRFLDLVRWGDAPKMLGNQGKEIYNFSSDGKSSVQFTNTSAGFVAGKHEHLPIPLKELELNPNMKQNEGWR
ncbi:SusD family protein [Bacteroidales bacterium KA00344]|nr:SusD family protein [Bacteroidales bacterium KA00344]